MIAFQAGIHASSDGLASENIPGWPGADTVGPNEDESKLKGCIIKANQAHAEWDRRGRENDAIAEMAKHHPSTKGCLANPAHRKKTG